MFGGFEGVDCSRCCNDPGLRARWGCVIPAKRAIGDIPCLICSGRDKECPKCSGSGSVPIFRCPESTASKAMRGVVLFYNQWSNGVLPSSGGILDQTSSYIESMRLLDLAQTTAANKKKARSPEGGQDLRKKFGNHGQKRTNNSSPRS